MSTYLLFCTANVPVETINTLLQTPRHNFFSLVHHPRQATFDDPTNPPVPSDFQTGFLDYTSAQIRTFISTNLPSSIEGTNLEPCQYAILDSADNNTIVIGHSYSPLLMRDPATMNDEERELWEEECDEYEGNEDEEWMEWRVKFEQAESLTTKLSFESDFTPKLYDREFVGGFVDGEGVLDVEAAFREWVEEDEAVREEEEEGEGEDE